jgi:hypothetical protein
VKLEWVTLNEQAWLPSGERQGSRAGELFLFVGHAWEAGWQGGPYAFVLVLALLQVLRPTVLGWLLCAIPCIAYLVLFIAEAPLNPIGEWFAFLLVGLLPALALGWARPRAQQSTDEPALRRAGGGSDDAG